MTVQMVIEVQDRQGVQTIVQALDGRKARLRSGIERTKRRLATFEARYGEAIGKLGGWIEGEETRCDTLPGMST